MLNFLIRKKEKQPEKKANSKKNKPQSQKEYFDNILSFANSVLNHSSEQNQAYKKYYSKGNEHPILDVVRLVGRNVQTKYLTSLLVHKDETSLPSLFPETAFFGDRTFLTDDYKRLYDFKKEVKSTKSVDLNKDLILPWPWKRSRLISAICNIGENRRWGNFKQDFNNHYVELWLPLGIAWVQGGNHSIASGILQGKGTLKPVYTYDISDVYDVIYTDGLNYYRKKDNVVICTVNDVDFAALFEIGRLMNDYDITF
jgi:hypothetical protein